MRFGEVYEMGSDLGSNACDLAILPLAYRELHVTSIMQWIRAGDSCSIVGCSGMAKSNLYRHLLSANVRQHFLGENWQTFAFLPLDSHSLGDLSERSVYDALAAILINGAQRLNLLSQSFGELPALGEEPALSPHNLNPREVFAQAIRLTLSQSSTHIVFLFDQFDEIYANLAPRFFANLRSIRDADKFRIAYVTFTRDELPRIRQSAECEEFYELVQSHVLALGPYNQDDSQLELSRIAARYRTSCRPTLGNHLFRITGGHPGLIKATYMSTLRQRSELPPQDQEALSILLKDGGVITECGKLWKSLREDEQQTLADIVQGSNQPTNTESFRMLQQKELVDSTRKIFSPLLVRYISQLLAPSRPSARIQAGPICIDNAGEVWLQGRKLQPSLTALELKLLTYLTSKAGHLCSKDEIVVAVYPEKYASGDTVSDAAVTALIERLRKRIEDDQSNPKFILTIRGKGYMFRL